MNRAIQVQKKDVWGVVSRAFPGYKQPAQPALENTEKPSELLASDGQ